ncbi:MAG: hypothetical protein U0414_32480 [Polyangiaceae bacterium]
MIHRREVVALGLRAIGASVLGGTALGGVACGAAPPAPAPPKLPPLKVDDLAGLVTAAGLSWIVLVKPRTIAQIAWLIPEIALFAPEKNLDVFEREVGVDLRAIPEAVVARFDDSLGGADLQLTRHGSDAEACERLFRKRITKQPVRAEDRPDVVRVSGDVGATPHAFARIGGDVLAYQEGGDVAKGPVRIATLYAQEKLKKTPRALDAEPLKSLRARFGDAPCIGLAVGPFDDDWKKAANGLLEAATGVGAALRPTARENIGFALAIAGDFHDSADAASATLMDAWDAFTATEMGKVLGLDHPVSAPIPSHLSDVVALSVEVEPRRFAEGLHALVMQDLDELMKLE